VCHVYGFLASQPTRVDCALVRSQQALVRERSAFSRNLTPASGWGAALFTRSEPVLYRKVVVNQEDFAFDPKAATMHTHAMLAHVRTATTGKAERRNTHPFDCQSWVFAHSGTIENFQTLRRELMGELNPEFRRSIQGSTDSEHAFYLFLSYLKRSAGSIGGDAPVHRIQDSFLKTVEMLNEMTGRAGSKIRSRLVFFATNQQVLLASRQGGDLFMLERDRASVCTICGESHTVMTAGEPYRCVVLATEPLSGEGWGEVPEGNVVLVDPDLAVTLVPFAA
jgi:glutamine amidotransferase